MKKISDVIRVQHLSPREESGSDRDKGAVTSYEADHIILVQCSAIKHYLYSD